VGPANLLAQVVGRLRQAGRPVQALVANTAEEWAAAWAQIAAATVPDRLLLLAPMSQSGVTSQGIPRVLRALANQPPTCALRIGLVCNGTSAVLGDEALDPDQALAIGWLQVLPTELPTVQTLCLDLDGFDEASIDAALQAVQQPPAAPWLARRHGHWWQRGVAPLLQKPLGEPALPLRPGGVYAISGGLGAVGLALAEHLARTVQARLVLFSRQAFPPPEQWAAWCDTHPGDDPTSRTIARLQALQQAGAELLIARADVVDRSALADLHGTVQARWGAVHGLIHCAGAPGGGLIAMQQDATSAPVLEPKRQGTLALLDTFAGDDPDFLLLCSSLTSFVPLVGRSDYTAANLWLDTLAQARAGTRPAIVSVNFDNWTEAGMARQAAGHGALVGLSHAEGVAAFALAIVLGEPQLLAAARDLQAIPAPTASTADDPVPAADINGASPASINSGTPAERQLQGLVADLLGLPQVGLQDDFFELGGDSVVSIQLVSRARRAGLSLTVKQVFQLRTVTAMAAANTATPAASPPTQQAADGRLCLTPAQHWFFSLPLREPGHWNLGLTLQTPVDADPALVRRCLETVVARHASLRSSFERINGNWVVALAPAAELDFQAIDLSALADDALPAPWAQLQAEACAPFDLAGGRLLRARHAHCGSRPGRLFIGIHHLVIDLIGARLLAEDLADAWRQHSGGAALLPAAAEADWVRWTGQLQAHAQTPAVTATLPRWVALAAQPHAALPRERQGSNHNDSAATLRIALDAHRSAHLLAQVGGGVGMAGTLLAGLAQALCAWSGQPQVWIDIEGHGREPIADSVDPGRIVGWFTAHHPLPVLRPSAELAVAARQTAQALRDLPSSGFSHGLLRHLHADPAVRREMARLPQPEVVFLYQGRRSSSATAGDSALPLLDFGRAAGDVRSHVFEINSWLDDTGLQIDWTYSRALHSTATVVQLAADFEQALSAMAEPALPQPVRAAPLSFAQERIWFLQQLDPDATVYNKQGVVELDGELDATALRAALGELVQRHDALRTRFTAVDGTPGQVVDAAGPVALPLIDLQGADEAEAERVARLRGAQRFELAATPPFNAALLRLGPTRHWLLLTLHHIVVDAWSLQVLVGDLAALYSAQRRGVPAALPALPLQLAHFAQAQRRALSGAALEALLAHWTERLVHLSPLELPTDRPRPAVQCFEGGRLAFRWPAGLTAAVRQLGREQGASLFMCLLALYKLLLQRYSGQSDIVVGIPAADRPDVETESLVGPLVNNLVLRTDLSGEPDLRAVLARVRETVLAANEHRDLPFEKLVEALRPPRDRSRSPLFQVMFAYMNVPESKPVWHGLAGRTREIETGGAEFDLSLYAYAPGNGLEAGLSGWFDYSSALFDRSTIERLAGHLQRLAEAACAEPARRAALLPLLSAAELAQIEAWNRTDAVMPPAQTLHQLFEQQAQRTPDAIAAVFDDRRFSYRELDAEANRLARHLRRLGIGADDRVALCMDRVGLMLVGLLGILKAGAAYVPVDPSYPADRIAHMLDDSGARAVLTQQRWLPHLPARTMPSVCLDAADPAWTVEDAQPLPPVAQARHLAYVIYTSGSTGKPKGVQIEHGAVVNFVQAMAARPGMAAGEALLAVTTISFDIHVLELFVPLAVGGCVVVASRETAADPQRLMAALAHPSIRVMQATPSTWRMLVDAGWQGGPQLKLLCGGEALASDLAQALLARCGELWNMYGPTEATVWATIERITASGPAITIGRPFDNMRAYVLDRLHQPQPVGVPGELCLGGQGIARGYLNRPQLTAERFIANPFIAGERIYRTGDLARWRADGRIEVLGRLDDQIKLRGHRIELGEIEAVLGSHPAIAHCVMWLREDRPGDQRLVAYAMPSQAPRPELNELRRFAGRTLPDYMLPSAIVWLDRFPLTPNGKVDRRALPAPAAPVASGQAELALLPAEAFFAGLFAEVLDIQGVGRYDNFFDLGGHSLLVMKVVDRVEQRSGIRMHPGELFQQTVGQLAAQYGARLPLPAPAVHAPVQRPAEPIEALFFAGSAGRLYGCHHRPTGPASGRAVLLCAPIAHEYARCHRALRQLAALLARRGHQVLRFDYFGQGDAEGEADALRLAQCQHDVSSAIGELRQRSGAAVVTLIGLRLGATLALQAAQGRADVDRLVLWHPVVDGPALLREWQDDHREFIHALGYSSQTQVAEVLGSPLPEGLAQEIAAITPDSLATPGSASLVIEATDRHPRGRAWPPAMVLAEAPIWRQQPLEAIVPSQAMQAIAHWLGRTA
jgi:amino acid adenylation domain-containing protein/non-ribosomal peptide synthase protein (TIGR01720 family)